MIKISNLKNTISVLVSLLLLSACQSVQNPIHVTAEIETASASELKTADVKTPPLSTEIIATAVESNKQDSAVAVNPLEKALANIQLDTDKTEPGSEKSSNTSKPNKNPLVVQEILKEAELALNHELDEENNNAWLRLQQGMQMNQLMNKRIQSQLNWYLKHPKYLTRVMQRAKPVLPFVLDELERKELPTEFALLPIVESAYQTFAYSHGRASGMWQIIPSTGKHLGLKQNWWYDGRRDIIESTRAATKYLKSLARQFDNDWELALASYNAGPGKVRSAIRYNKKKGRKTDFWHLTRLRRETLDYVPKLLALKAIFEDPQKYGIELLYIDNVPEYEIVELDSQLDLALAAEMADLTTEELYQLNPAFNRWATAPNGPHRLLLPKSSVDNFNTELAALPKNKHINWKRHKIKQGHTLSELAIKYRTSTELIKQVNNLKGTQIRAGKYLLIPTATKSIHQYSLSKSSRLNKIKNTSRKGSKLTHTVKSGESFWSISRKYGVSTRSLAKWNGMAPIDTLSIGQKLVIWKSKAKAQRVSLVNTSPSQKMHALRYTVRKGDSLSRIADKFNIRVSDIKKWNKVGKYLQPGQKLKLYVDITRQSG